MLLKLFIISSVLITFSACEFTYNDLPVDQEDAPLVIETLITLEKISSFNLKELEYSMIFFQEQFWKIKREKCDYFYLDKLNDFLNVNLTAGQAVGKKYNINLSHIRQLAIWVPNSFQIDSKSIAKIPLSNELIELELKKDYCHFNLRTRLNVKVGCQMYFKNYPNDIQICPFRLTSYTYPLDSVVFRWRSPGVITNRLVKQINQYTLSLSKFQYNSTKYDDKVKFSYLEISLRFENHLSHFCMQIVVPTYFIISIVYLNLYMRPDGSPGRFLLTILTFICLVTIYTSSRDKLPALAYANAVDLWMLGNLFFVFLAILELVVNSFLNKRKTKKLDQARQKMRAPSSEIYIITPESEVVHGCNNQNSKLRNDNMSNFMYNNASFNGKEELQKSNENLNSEVITVGSSNNLVTVGSSNNLLTITGRETPLHSTVHSSIENVLTNHIKRLSMVENQMMETIEKKEKSFDLDRISRVWWLVLYFAFNLIYWVLLLNRWFDFSVFSDNDDIVS